MQAGKVAKNYKGAFANKYVTKSQLRRCLVFHGMSPTALTLILRKQKWQFSLIVLLGMRERRNTLILWKLYGISFGFANSI